MRKIIVPAVLALLAACQQPTPPPAEPAASNDTTFDVILSGGTIVDGLGNTRFTADVGIRGDRIAAVGDFFEAQFESAGARAARVGVAGGIFAIGSDRDDEE